MSRKFQQRILFNRAVIAALFVCILCIYVIFVSYLGYHGTAFILTLAISFIAGLLYISMTSRAQKISYIFGLSLLTPKISVPLTPYVNMIPDILSSAVLADDRFEFGLIILLSVGLIMVIESLILISKESKFVRLIAPLYIIFFAISILVHDFTNLSSYQVFLDSIIILLAASLIIQMRSEVRYHGIDRIFRSFKIIFLVFSVITLIDYLLSATSLFPWSLSYRSHVQGVFYGNEVLFSFALGFSFLVLFQYTRSAFYRGGLLIIMLTAYIMTNISTLWVSFALGILLVSFRFNKFMVILAGALGIAIMSATLPDYSSSTTTSTGVRIATYWIYLDFLLRDINIIIGIMPGLLSTPSVSNLQEAIFQSGYSHLLTGLPDTMTSELLERSSYSEGGSFLPHNFLLALLSSYGIIITFPILLGIYRVINYWLANFHIVRGDMWVRIFVSSWFFIFFYGSSHPYTNIILFVALTYLVPNFLAQQLSPVPCGKPPRVLNRCNDPVKTCSGDNLENMSNATLKSGRFNIQHAQSLT